MKPFEGIWVTMVTPFTERKTIDYEALDALVEHFVRSGIDGLFAVCQSSEMFALSPRERERLCRHIVNRAAGRIRVIASGHVSYEPEEQLEDALRAQQAGAEAAVLLTSMIASRFEDDETWWDHAQWLMDRLPSELPLGLYECPAPYKRLLSPELVGRLATSGRFVFLKETSCSLAQIDSKLRAAQGSAFSILNANAQLLVPSIRLGAAGFSGIMANMQAPLYAYLWDRRALSGQGGLYDALAGYLAASSALEASGYPASAKYVLNRMGVRMNVQGRANPCAELSEPARYMLDRFVEENSAWQQRCEREWGQIGRNSTH